jgi:hypothetical protein
VSAGRAIGLLQLLQQVSGDQLAGALCDDHHEGHQHDVSTAVATLRQELEGALAIASRQLTQLPPPFRPAFLSLLTANYYAKRLQLVSDDLSKLDWRRRDPWRAPKFWWFIRTGKLV